MKKAELAIKRFIDVIGSLVGVIVLLPLFLILAVYIKFHSNESIIYRQERIGYKGKPFIIIKFQTMTQDKDRNGRLLPDGERLKPWGKKLREISFDELPQLFCVIKGDMSLVGPRPLPTLYLPRYTSEEMRRHDMKPGITGWAQVNGRNNQSWEQKFKKDIWYIDNWSIWLDIVILFKTIPVVLKRQNINQTGYTTAEEFRKTNHNQ